MSKFVSSSKGSDKVGRLVQLEIDYGRGLLDLNSNPYLPFAQNEYNQKIREVVDQYLYGLNQEVGYGSF